MQLPYVVKDTMLATPIKTLYSAVVRSKGYSCTQFFADVDRRCELEWSIKVILEAVNMKNKAVEVKWLLSTA